MKKKKEEKEETDPIYTIVGIIIATLLIALLMQWC